MYLFYLLTYSIGAVSITAVTVETVLRYMWHAVESIWVMLWRYPATSTEIICDHTLTHQAGFYLLHQRFYHHIYTRGFSGSLSDL